MSEAMGYWSEGDSVTLRMSRDDFALLMIAVGYMSGGESKNEENVNTIMLLANRLNQGNPAWTPLAPWRSKASPEAALYYIQARGFSGDCLVFWRKEKAGYTTNLGDAMQVTKQEADQITGDSSRGDSAWPVKELDLLSYRHVDSECSEFRRMRDELRQKLPRASAKG